MYSSRSLVEGVLPLQPYILLKRWDNGTDDEMARESPYIRCPAAVPKRLLLWDSRDNILAPAGCAFFPRPFGEPDQARCERGRLHWRVHRPGWAAFRPGHLLRVTEDDVSPVSAT